MSELTASLSVWLPIGRANFYSATANGWLQQNTGPQPTVKSDLLESPGYVPRLQVSVLRRVLEVLPVSFGYNATGVCEVSGEGDLLARPVAVTMTLRPKEAHATLVQSHAEEANLALVRAGVDEVRFRVDEHGAYTFTAAGSGTETQVRDALEAHALEVFGGDYSLDRRSGHARGASAHDDGSAAVRRYQGIGVDSPGGAGKPRGILTFFQLNTLVEGLFNEALSPAVFFEQNEFLRDYLANEQRGSLTLVERMSQAIGLLVVDADAGRPEGLALALKRFLDASAREVLQKLKWSVESVRRSLLDESVSMLHRQSELVQLNLGALEKERTPELAEGASQSQLRGYVMLVAAKLPLVRNVYEFAVLAKDHLGEVAAHAQGRTAVHDDVRGLKTHLEHWKALLEGLSNNVRGLERALEHAWRETLLYEQQQVRAEQEAMAEIERGRAGRPARRAGESASNLYNFLMLFLAVAAVLVTVRNEGGPPAWPATLEDLAAQLRGLAGLFPIAGAVFLFGLAPLLAGSLLRRRRAREGRSDAYPYEFMFRLEETADPAAVRRYLSVKGRRRLSSKALKRLTLTCCGGGRIERVTQDRALVKIHSTATFRVGVGRYARFEIVNEILAHRVSEKPTYVIMQCRMFGESPRPLKPGEVIELAEVILRDVGDRLTTDNPQTGDAAGIDVDKVLRFIAPLYRSADA